MKLSKEAREARRAYKREWAKKNPEKIRKYQIDYWERKAKDMAETKDDQPMEAL